MSDTNRQKPMNLLRWVVFGWMYWLQSRPGNLFWMRALGVIGILVAGPLLLALIVSFPRRLADFEQP